LSESRGREGQQSQRQQNTKRFHNHSPHLN
jgi:hypothetical protein